MSFIKKHFWQCLTTFGLACWVGTATAATITVDSADQALNPGGVCTLRGAVDAMNNGADANGCTATGAYGANDTIRFSLGTATITLAATVNNHMTIRRPLTIDGDGNNITLDGNNANRIFYAGSGCTSLMIKRLTFQNGKSSLGSGGAIAVEINSGQPANALTVEDSVFIGNQANFSGGAIDITDANSNFSSRPPSTLLIERSSFINNTVDRYGGGALWAYDVTIRNSTFSGNSVALNYGGAVWANDAIITNSTFADNTASNSGGAIRTENTLVATHLTLVNNHAPTGAAIYIARGGGTLAPLGTGSLKNSLIVSGSGVTVAQCAVGTGATLTGGTNLEWRNGANENSCNSSTAVLATVTAPEDIVATTLANNGGPTETLTLPDGSPAIDTGDPSVGLTTDQRGQPRPQGSGPDLGAFEATPKQPKVTIPVPALGMWGLLALIGLMSTIVCRVRRT